WLAGLWGPNVRWERPPDTSRESALPETRAPGRRLCPAVHAASTRLFLGVRGVCGFWWKHWRWNGRVSTKAETHAWSWRGPGPPAAPELRFLKQSFALANAKAYHPHPR